MSGPVARPVADRLWPKVRIGKPEECWPFTGALDKGYGKIKDGARVRTTHRVSYELTVGPIPVGYEIDHLCRNPACVNPGHLEAVTPRTNNLRSNSLAARRSRQTHCLRGHLLAGDNVRLSGRGQRNCRACQRMHDSTRDFAAERRARSAA